jgi:PAS domain S-box-containing protein
VKRILPPLIAVLVGLVALALTLGLWTHERRSEQARLRAIFDFNLRQTATRIEQRVANYEQMLRGLQGLFMTADRVDRASFERYVDSVMAGPDAAGLQAFGYMPLLAAGELPAYLAARRADGFPAFAVRPEGARELYSPITYLAPRRPENERAFGFDPLTDPARRAAMMQARDSGNLAITRRVRLSQDVQAQPGFVMFLPLYRAGPLPGTLAARRAGGIGWVTASFRIGDLMSTLYGEESPGIVLQLHDGADATEATLMYRSGAAPAAGAGPPRFESQEYIAFAGHAWTLQLSSLPEFEQRHGQDSTGVILVAGLVLSMLLALLTFQLLTGRARATAAAQAMTHELRASEERYRRIVETAGEGIWLCDAQMRISFANARIARWLGWSEAGMAGRPLSDFMDAAQAERCREVLGEGRAGDGQVIELRLRRRDGSETWVAASMRPIVDDAGRPAGGLGMLTDINERRLAEERRNALEAQLRDAQKMEAIGTLAGGIAHDFNNILAAILGNVAVARQDAAAGAANDASLAQIERSAVRARALVQQILTFSRMQAQELRIQALQPMIEETLEMLRAAMPAQVELDVRLPPDPVWVRADATQMQQVVMNLCTNAWHALPGGRGRIEVGVGVDGAGDQASARLWVADNGSGMDAATRARVFEPFFTTKQVGHGTGLGLAVVHGIVSVHGGSIELDSRPGVGTRFDLRFPLQPAPRVEPLAPAPEVAAPRGTGQHVLCVDDDPAMVLMTETLLQRAGYRVSVFDHPLAALAAASADPAAFDIAVSDYNMPEMNGMELAQALARIAPALPVIITSGFISDEMRQQAGELGVALLQKEYTLERLGSLVHSVLASSAARAR